MRYYLQTEFLGSLKVLSIFCVDLTWNDPCTCQDIETPEVIIADSTENTILTLWESDDNFRATI